jgi:hypothetical protein
VIQLACLLDADQNDCAKSVTMCKYLLEQHRNFDQQTKKVFSGIDPRIIFLNQVTSSSDHTFTLRLALQAAPTFELFSYLWNTFDPSLYAHPLTLIPVARFLSKFKSEWSSDFLQSLTTRFVYNSM